MSKVEKSLRLARARTLVRCLGPGREHTFFSEDPARRRICFACSVKINGLHALQREPKRVGVVQ